MLNENTRMIRCQDLLEADVNGEIVALHIEKGQCYGLNEVGSRVWALLAEPMLRRLDGAQDHPRREAADHPRRRLFEKQAGELARGLQVA